jgi:hypothetical protein
MIEIKLDRQTLPNDGQKVKWQTTSDINNRSWKEGIFSEGDDLFCVGFEKTAHKWDTAWDVHFWEPLPE